MKEHKTGWAVHVACVGQTGNAYEELYRKPDGKTSPGRPRRALECTRTTQFYLTERGRGGLSLCGYSEPGNTP